MESWRCGFSLREFRTQGEVALRYVPKEEVILLSGQKGPAHFLIPAQGDLAGGDRELKRVMVVAFGPWWIDLFIPPAFGASDEQWPSLLWLSGEHGLRPKPLREPRV